MVNQEVSFQNLILDVFEEQEDAFFFPLRSQKDARAFVKAIHKKGVPWEDIYGSIGEFEHNFSCWRNGLGRPGIGNRVIDLINKPLVDLLEEEDNYLSLNGSHPNGLPNSSKLEPQRSWEDNNRVPPTHHSNGHNQNASSRPSRTTSVDETDSGSKAKTASNHRDNPPSQQKNQSTTESSQEKSPLPTRSELRRVEQSDKPSENKEESPRRMVELRRTPPRQEKKERPVSELEKMKQQILSKKQEQEEPAPPRERKHERSSSSSSGSSESESGSSSPSSSESDTKVEKVLGKFDAIKITDSPVEEAPPKKPERLFLDEKKEEKKEETKEEKTVENKEETKKITEAEQHREELKKEEQRLEEQKREERKEQLKRIKEKYNQATSGGGVSPEDVDENYNSDLDPENTNQSPVMATLVKKISSMRAAGKNSTGYIYVFSDSPQGSSKVRVKVGSSRCPNKRLQQAKCFNPDMYLVATYSVSQRVTALNDIQNSLANAKLEGASDWFTGPLDNLLQIVQDNAGKYPTKTLHDATTDQSES